MRHKQVPVNGDNSYRVARHEVVRSTSLTSPGVRLLLVVGWTMEDGSSGTRWLPVVAVRSKILDIWRKLHPVDETPEIPAASWSRRAWTAAGWVYQREAVLEYVVTDQRDGVAVLDACVEYGTWRTFIRLVPAQWPPSDDAERLRPILEELEADTRWLAAHPLPT